MEKPVQLQAVAVTPEPTPNYDVPGMVRVLLAWHRVKTAELAKAIGLSQPSLSDRLTGKLPFKDDEIQRMSSFFGVTPGVFYLNLDQLLKASITRLKSAITGKEPGQHLAVVASNPQRKGRQGRRPLMTTVAD